MTDPPSVLPEPNVKARMRLRWRRLLGFALVVSVGWWGVGLIGALMATSPRPAVIPSWSELAGRALESVTITAGDGVQVRGWLADPDAPRRRVVVLVAGIGGDRVTMTARARWYVDNGWSALMLDLRGTGASDASRISMGWHEALDLTAACGLLRSRGYTTVGVHGQSLGAAAAALTAVRSSPPPAWDFLVLEACYSDIRAALAARTPYVPAWLSWPMLTCSEWLLGLDVDDLDAVAALRHVTAPTLLVCGDRDTLVGPDATNRLFDSCAATVRRRYLVAGAGHRDLWSRGGEALRATLQQFLQAL